MGMCEVHVQEVESCTETYFRLKPLLLTHPDFDGEMDG